MLYNAGTDLPGSRLSLTNLFVKIHTLLKEGMYFLPVEKDSSRRGSDVGVGICYFLKGLSKLHVLEQ